METHHVAFGILECRDPAHAGSDLRPGHADDTARLLYFLLTLYGKGEKEDLSAADLKRVVKLLEELTNG